MLHKQRPTIIVTDNYTEANIMNNYFKQQRSKSIDIYFYCIWDQIKKNQFLISWVPVQTNLGDYISKHHSLINHNQMRPFFFHADSSPDATLEAMRVCVDSYIGALRKNNLRSYTTQDDATQRSNYLPTKKDHHY